MANVNAGFLLSDLYGDPAPQPVDFDTLIVDYSGFSGGLTANWVNLRFDIPGNTSGRESVELSDGTLVAFRVDGFDAFTVTATAGNDTIGTVNGNDLIYSGAGDDVMLTGGGDDTVYGGDGDDTIIDTTGVLTVDGGAGNDTIQTQATSMSIDGGTGIDTLSFYLFGTTDAVTADVTTGAFNSASITGSGIERLTGTLSDADDVINAGFQLDTLFGGSGDDTLTLDYSGTSWDGLTATSVNLRLDSGSNSTGRESVTLSDLSTRYFQSSNFETFSVTGSTGNDAIFASNGDDMLDGAGGDDGLFGGGGDDTLIGGAGADQLNGGNGIDTADYSGAGAAVTVSLAAGAGFGGDANGDTFFSIEKLVGSNFNDVLLGDNASNTVDGGSGSDVLSGEGGSDVLYGGAGFDALSGADGGAGVADTLFGGAGLDIAYYFTAETALVIDLSDNTNLATNSGEHALDTWVSIEGVYGANAHSNTITGDAQDNLFLGGDQADVLYGGGGSDILTARGGDDLIYGGIGNDFISGDAGNDDLYGDAGQDTFYIFATSNVDRLKDFSLTDDTLLFFQTGATQWSDLDKAQVGNDVHVTLSGGGFTVIVENVLVAELDGASGGFAFL